MGPLKTVAALVVLAITGSPEGLGYAQIASTAEAQQPVRTAIHLPVPAAKLAAALSFPTHDRSRLMLDVIRLLHGGPTGAQDDTVRVRAIVDDLLRTPASPRGETVPLPLGPDIWRTAIVEQPVPDDGLAGAILTYRSAALLYYGLAALDDETLRWLASDADTLRHLRKHAGAFAAFGRSVRVRARRVDVPGGPEADVLWQALTGSAPSDPAAFIRSVFKFDRGRLAFFYDAVAHLEGPRQRMALGGPGDERRAERFRALAGAFHDFAPDWDIEVRPFSRGQLDPLIALLNLGVDAAGVVRGPGLAVLDEAFRDDATLNVAFREIRASSNLQREGPADPSWIVARTALVPHPVGRRRLDALLFAQRAVDTGGAPAQVVATVLRAFLSMPALMLTLERAGVRDPSLLIGAAQHGWALHGIGDDEARWRAVAGFQCAVAFVSRGVTSRAITAADASRLISSLTSIDAHRGDGYEERLATWLRTSLFTAAPAPPVDTSEPIEAAVLALLAGTRATRPTPIVEWEGRQYRADPAGAELQRMRRVRERQGGVALDAAIAALLDGGTARRKQTARARQEFVDTLMSVLYAVYLGDPEGVALAAGNVALKHDLEADAGRPGLPSMTAWRLPVELFGGAGGWRVQGSLLGLDAALRRLSFRRLDQSLLPAGRRLPLLERQVTMLTVTLMNPHELSDDDRDRLAEAIGRGRERYAAVRRDPKLLDAFAADGGLGEWRREALRWALAYDPDHADDHVTLRDFLYAGSTAARRTPSWHAWGAAATPLSGCLCLRMPDPTPWESLAGRPAAGFLATHGIDVTLRVAERLAALKLPASLTPAIVAFAMLDVTDAVQPVHFDDWHTFSREAVAIPDDRLLDYVGALAADGPLVPVARNGTPGL